MKDLKIICFLVASFIWGFNPLSAQIELSTELPESSLRTEVAKISPNSKIIQNSHSDAKIGVFISPLGNSDEKDGGNLISFGINYVKDINKTIAFETGVEYSTQEVTY